MNISKWLISTRSFNILTLALLLFLLLRIDFVRPSEKCMPSLNTPGWTYPQGDIALKVGENLTAYCLLDPEEAKQKNYSSEQIFFLLSNERVPQENVTLLNSTAAVLNLYNMSVMNNWLHCKLDVADPTPPGSSLESPASNDTIVCSNIVAVGTRPRDVENFSCRSYDWKELNCTWIEPYNEVRTVYEVSYQIPKRGGRLALFKCPEIEDAGRVEVDGKDLRRRRCSWTSRTNPAYRNNFEFFTFIIVGSNFIANHTQTIKYHNYAHIIPSAPKQFEVVDKTISSVLLRWTIDQLVTFDKGWYYKLSYTWNQSGAWNITEFSPRDKTLIRLPPDEIRVNVTGLKYPDTVYDFRVSMRSAVAPQNEGWSEPSSLIVKTKSCPPYRSPKTDRSSFEISSSESTDDYRVVFIYWQPIPRLERNGDNFTYDIKVWKDGALSNDSHLISVQNSYAKYRIKFDTYKFVIRSKNVDGLSPNSSEVNVPSKDTILRTPPIVSKVDYGEGVYELSWKAIESRYNVSYTAFWCETDREYPYQCDGFIDWVHVEGDAIKFNFRNNYAAGRNSVGYQFAVSAVTADSSSGMTWASCTVLHDTVNKINSLWIDKIESYYIYIRWKLECSNRVDSIRGYYIYYCPLETPDKNKCNKDKEKTITVYGDLDTDQANITELEAYKYYQIQIAMFTRNITGPRSEPLIERTLDGPPDVTGILVEPINSTNDSIILKWNSVNNTNGVLRRFLIIYNDNVTEIPANTTQAVLSNLTSYQEYNIKLKACTLLCSPAFGALKVTTKIGKPGKAEGLNMLSMNNTHVLVEWNQLNPPGGPHPFFKVRYMYNGSSERDVEKDVVGNYTVIEKHMCSSEVLLIQVRGVNKDDKTNRIYEGEWSKTLRLLCPDEPKQTLIPRSIVYGIVFVFLLSLAIFGAVKFSRKIKKMKDITVTLPGSLSVPQFKHDLNGCNFYEDYNLRITKSGDEVRNLVDKTTELSLFSSQP